MPNSQASAALQENWHLDRKVPITIIITVISGIATGLWFAAIATHRIEILEKDSAFASQRLDAMGQTSTVMRERLARIEQQGSDNQDMLRRILERLK